MSLVKTSLINGISVAVRMISLLGINKALAAFVGPAGYTLIGQLQNIIQIITSIAGGALGNGVIRYTSELEGDPKEQYFVWSNSFKLGGSISLITSLISFLFSDTLSTFFFKTNDYSYIFLWLGFSIPLYVFNSILLAILNGKNELKRLVFANIIGSVISLLFIVLIVYKWRLEGALIALSVHQSLSFFVSLYFVVKTKWFKFQYFLFPIDKRVVKNFVRYFFMAITSAVIAPAGQMVVRDTMLNRFSPSDTGNWEALFKLSSAYLLFITSTLSVYYLPKISKIKIQSEIREEVVSCLKLIIPVLILTSSIIYIYKDFVVTLLFSNDFFISDKSFIFQIIIGDTIKTGAWLLGFILVAKGEVKIYFLSELIFFIVFILSTRLLIPSLSSDAPAAAYSVSYGVYFIFVLLGLRRRELI